MSQMFQQIKLWILSWLVKGRDFCQRVWKSFFPSKIDHLKEDKVEIEENVFATSRKYDRLFPLQQSKEHILVSETVWNKIQDSIPSGYIIPNEQSLHLLSTMSSDYYNNFFHDPPSTPHLFVEGEVWKKIMENIREDYIIPTSLFEKVMTPMSSDYYDKLFPQSYKTSKVFVDNQIWEQIIKNIPESYSIPSKHTDSLISKLSHSNHNSILMKPQF
ncbi:MULTISPECIES: hypothetical protein [unclassified Psychrobacillus]|uniref:hypothetical protein n=1 Tax=unclassified Psychrobacillus TaxID=2636677 RepID=UPI0030FC7576